MNKSLDVVILAAGQGTRMRSARPKVLHSVGGKPMLERVIEAAEALRPDTICVIYGHGGDQVRSTLEHKHVAWAVQAEQLGTGHAVAQGIPHTSAEHVLILSGDVPLISVGTLRRLIDHSEPDTVSLLTVGLENPCGYGRILREGGDVVGIVEEKDASEEQRQIQEVNTGILSVPRGRLEGWLKALDNANAAGEFYLTDIISMAVRDKCTIATEQPTEEEETYGVNDRAQLAAVERHFQRREVDALMKAGVTFRDPSRVDIRGTVTAEQDVEIDVNVILSGDVHLGAGTRIGPNNEISDARIGSDCEVLANCVIEQAAMGNGCRIGPFSRLRPGAELADQVHIGNFVEIKKSTIGLGSKANHLSYVGDSEVGAGVNIGAGTITCNYDGANKHKTTIGDGAFIGSGVELVAPIEVGAGATVGAGSTISRPAPPHELTVERSRQKTVAGWQRPVKEAAKS